MEAKVFLQGNVGELVYICGDVSVAKEDGGRIPLILIKVDNSIYPIECTNKEIRDKCFDYIISGRKVFPKMTRPMIVTDDYAHKYLSNNKYSIEFLMYTIKQVKMSNTKSVREWGVFKNFNFDYFEEGNPKLLDMQVSERLAMGFHPPKNLLCHSKITPEQFWHYLLFSPVVQEYNQTYLAKNKNFLTQLLK